MRYIKISKKYKIFLLILITIFILFFSFNFFISKVNSPPPITQPKNEEKIEKNISFIYKEQSPITVYNFMKKLQNNGEIYFKEKNYTGMGIFIEEINGIKNGEKYWIYYINNKKANIGVSNYQINNGDIVSWEYESR